MTPPSDDNVPPVPPSVPVRAAMSPKLRFSVLVRDGFACTYCGRRAPDVDLHVDHIHPVSKGGTNEMSNLAAACTDCNAGKRDRILPPELVPAKADAPLLSPSKVERPRKSKVAAASQPPAAEPYAKPQVGGLRQFLPPGPYGALQVGHDVLHAPIFWVRDQWAVTAIGIQRTDGAYAIKARDLWQDDDGYGWLDHMAEKEWVDINEFTEALEWSRKLFFKLKP